MNRRSVSVPYPVKIGTKLWMIHKGRYVVELTVTQFRKINDSITFVCKGENGTVHLSERGAGKTYFFTKNEAEVRIEYERLSQGDSDRFRWDAMRRQVPKNRRTKT